MPETETTKNVGGRPTKKRRFNFQSGAPNADEEAKTTENAAEATENAAEATENAAAAEKEGVDDEDEGESEKRDKTDEKDMYIPPTRIQNEEKKDEKVASKALKAAMCKPIESYFSQKPEAPVTRSMQVPADMLDSDVEDDDCSECYDTGSKDDIEDGRRCRYGSEEDDDNDSDNDSDNDIDIINGSDSRNAGGGSGSGSGVRDPDTDRGKGIGTESSAESDNGISDNEGGRGKNVQDPDTDRGEGESSREKESPSEQDGGAGSVHIGSARGENVAESESTARRRAAQPSTGSLKEKVGVPRGTAGGRPKAAPPDANSRTRSQFHQRPAFARKQRDAVRRNKRNALRSAKRLEKAEVFQAAVNKLNSFQIMKSDREHLREFLVDPPASLATWSEPSIHFLRTSVLAVKGFFENK